MRQHHPPGTDAGRGMTRRWTWSSSLPWHWVVSRRLWVSADWFILNSSGCPGKRNSVSAWIWAHWKQGKAPLWDFQALWSAEPKQRRCCRLGSRKVMPWGGGGEKPSTQARLGWVWYLHAPARPRKSRKNCQPASVQESVQKPNTAQVAISGLARVFFT